VLAPSIRELYFGSQREHVSRFSMERLVRRFGHLPEFAGAWPALRNLYSRARAEGQAEPDGPSPERLADVLCETSGGPEPRARN
jgi:hypothetical protein